MNNQEKKKQKILFYYHNFGGLGHGTRIFSLCRFLKEDNPNYELLIINSGIPQPELNLTKFAKVINLPPIESTNMFNELPSDKNLDMIFKKRADIIGKINSLNSYDIAIFEHFPFGRDFLENEIIDFIKQLKLKNCKIYSSVRDIIEQKIDETKLDYRLSFFDGIFVHSDENMGFLTSFDKKPSLIKKLFYTGRVFHDIKKNRENNQEIKKLLGINKEKLIIASIGGGIDGDDILENLIESKNLIDKKIDSVMLISTGPSLSEDKYEALKKKVKSNNKVFITRYNPDYMNYISAADLSLSMGGYNSINNALVTDTSSIIFPRQSDKEQQIRAEFYNDYFKIINKSNLSKEEFVDLILTKINNNQKRKEIFENSPKFKNIIKRILDIKSMKIRLNSNCNFNCDMCSWKNKNENLNIEKVKKIIDQASFLGINIINFTGGEPTLYDHLKEVLEYCHSSSIKVSLSTNGFIKKDKLDSIIAYLNFVDISLDSFDPLLNNKIRGVPNGFEKTLETIKLLSEQNIPVHINTTLRPDNFISIHKLIPLLKEHIRSISFTLVDASMNKNNKFIFTKEELEKLYFDEALLILREAHLNNVKISITPFFKGINWNNPKEILTDILINKEEYKNNLVNIFQLEEKDCDLAKNQIRVNSSGEISPCCFLDDQDIDLGSINNSDLLSILSLQNKYNHVVSNAKEGIGECSSCKKGQRIYENILENE